jgi:transcription elongation factor Elf1
MIVRTRMMLTCPGCGEPKLMSVTIIDDIAGPALCDSCIARAKMERRQAAQVAQPMPPQPSPRFDAARPTR